jgi:hypothetical protein
MASLKQLENIKIVVLGGTGSQGMSVVKGTGNCLAFVIPLESSNQVQPWQPLKNT